MAPLALELDDRQVQEEDIEVEEVDNFVEPGQKNSVLKVREKYEHEFSNRSSILNEL